MHRQTLQDRLKTVPFEPFEVRLTKGDVHQVRHPENAMLLQATFVVGYPDSDRMAICAVNHIASVETIPVSHGRNGE